MASYYCAVCGTSVSTSRREHEASAQHLANLARAGTEGSSIEGSSIEGSSIEGSSIEGIGTG